MRAIASGHFGLPITIQTGNPPNRVTETDLVSVQEFISKVQTLTPWYAAMVVVPKPSGGIHICVDLKPLKS